MRGGVLQRSAPTPLTHFAFVCETLRTCARQHLHRALGQFAVGADNIVHLFVSRSWQAINGGVGDDVGLVANALEIFHPSRQDLCLISEQRPAVGTEKSDGTFDGRSVDSLGGGKEVIPFVSVHEPLDFLDFAGQPGILHLPQPLLYKATPSVGGCLVCSGRNIDVGFVQLVLLDEQSVDGCVVVIDTVLVLTTGAAEEIQGGGFYGVPQLAIAVLHRGVRIGDWKAG
ncbi:unnamed protein product [Schistocephalus solidus]|uniref:Uncharacterized protein n=1 Tax=Schistocephalus solidus TaxID=70667 RepID=A0A183SPV3_SCHSO|nr:unnamed protein product [Schistocephalus solidus]